MEPFQSGFHDWSLEDDVITDDVILEEDCISEGPDIRGVSPSRSNSDVSSLDDIFNELKIEDELATSEGIELNPFDGLPYSSLYYDLMEDRRKLPVWKAKDDFVMAVEESSVVLVTGRPGSGKTTQIPQWCLRYAKESNFKSGTVVSTQPSPLAAMSLAIQVAREMDFTEVGNEIGYKIPNYNCSSESTVLKFTTDEILLREMADDPLLNDYNFVIIDEAQERSLATDILLSLFKSICNSRADLKIIILCLPYEMEKLENLFEEVPVLDLHYIEEPDDDEDQDGGSDQLERKRREELERKRMSEVTVKYISIDESRLVDYVVGLVVELHCDRELLGDFIVFLPSSKEIEEACEKMTREIAMKVLRELAGDVRVVPLHRDLTPGDQQAVYDQLATSGASGPKKRRIIVSDESMEASFSTDGVFVVVDSGLKTEEVFNCRTRTNCSSRKRISRNSAILRASRCGRGGQIHRLYLEAEYQEMEQNSIPLIKRVELTSHMLLLKRLLQRLNMSFSECQFIDPPDPEAYMLALEELDYHGALDENGSLSDLGAVMSEFPLSVPQTKCVIASCGEDCVQEIVTIVAMNTAPPFWSIPRGSEEKGAEVKRKMAHEAGDHFTLLNIFQLFVRHKRTEAWCLKNFLNYASLKNAERKKEDLLSIMERLELPISNSIDDPRVVEISVKRALLAGHFMQVARDTDGCGNYLIIRDKHIARIHPESTAKQSSEWIVYDRFLLTEGSYVTMVSHVTGSWVAEVAPHSYLTNLPNHETKAFLLKVSARWRKKLGQAHKDVPETSKSRLGKQTDNDRTQNSGDSLENRTTQPARDESPYSENPNDEDVLTQAARGVAYAYHQAADYMKQPEGEETQCIVQ